MDNSNLADQKYLSDQCVQGMCHNHWPEWENVGNERCEPNPGNFGNKTYWFTRCCGAPMARYKKVQTKQCKKCGRQKDYIPYYYPYYYFALCLCCGRTTNMTSMAPDD